MGVVGIHPLAAAALSTQTAAASANGSAVLDRGTLMGAREWSCPEPRLVCTRPLRWQRSRP